jgi:hypothetical protein
MARVLVQKNVASAILLGDAPAEAAEGQLQPGHSKIDHNLFIFSSSLLYIDLFVPHVRS